MLNQKRLVSCLFLVAIVLGGLSTTGLYAAGQPYLSADEQDVQKLVADRNKFVLDMYQPAGAEGAKVLESLRELMPAQAQYQREVSLTLSRLRLALTITYHDTNVSQDERSARWKKFHSQYYRLLAKAPLSLRNAIRVAEAMMSSEQTSAGRARMAEMLAERIKASGSAFDIENIDGIVMGEITPGPPPVIQLPERPTPQPVVVTHDTPADATPPATAQQTPAPAQQTPAPAEQARPTSPPPPPAPPVARPAPGAPLPAAPPIGEWNAALTTAQEKYEFNESQVETAKNIVNQTIKSAEAMMDQNKAAMSEASAMPDGPDKAQKMESLNSPLNRLYDAMNKRLDSIASIEQRNRAAAKDAGK